MLAQIMFCVLLALVGISDATLWHANAQGSTQSLTDACSQFSDRPGGCNVDVDVPSGCVVSTRADCPLVFVFRLDDQDFVNWVTNISPIAHGTTFPFIGVYPRGGTDGSSQNGIQSYGWNVDGRTSVDDLSFVKAVVDHLVSIGHTGRKYALGFSNGAAMTQKAAVNYAAIGLSGIVPGATQLTSFPATLGPAPYNYNYPNQGSGTRKTAMLALHGSGDVVIPISGGGVLGGLYNLSQTKDSAALWAKVNGCGAPTVTTSTAATYKSESGSVSTTATSAQYDCNPAYATEYIEIKCDNHRTWDATINGKSAYQYAFDWIASVESACAADPALCSSPEEYTETTSWPQYSHPSCSDAPTQAARGNPQGNPQGNPGGPGGNPGGNPAGNQGGGAPPACSATQSSMCCGDGACDGPETSANCAADCNSRLLQASSCSCTADVSSNMFDLGGPTPGPAGASTSTQEGACLSDPTAAGCVKTPAEAPTPSPMKKRKRGKAGGATQRKRKQQKEGLAQRKRKQKRTQRKRKQKN